ncbi:hypothetical protein CO051_03770 [Candidatus Roizmanbacteria bacterium CG_4_9_14_0_2_um_filter_39_13]|uniref:Uncharacterized protein n=1 Tax=Candidatus Roizmanbacteria bacterium CG_4_9_14_0_2_um_filter_39_13 TaxID=1974839 RepID=A0A2M8EYR8_9BACT|nr:MAG: hypothetical protein COY15_02455 [Candidatus Roizmanbacteria bacterium CG_4_10_14_0_2_um_filter_39_12]PJC31773.1 MAG: hypothetical protein CO051_03770 [Candidatus Roizmanbacteria bacterium CG_4_9_14_0_2_um_filter_39_13]
MKNENSYKKYFTKKYLSFMLFISLDAIFLVFIVFLGYKIYGVYNQTVVLKQEIEQMKNATALIKNNKDLLQDNIADYNETLDKLIPDTETYFQVISAFEQLESRLGVSIESYSINLSETTEEKMSLSLTIKGTRENIESFLTNYNYYGGRLMTSEDFSYSAGNSDSISFDINLFHSLSDASSSGPSPTDAVISKEDIAFIQGIQKKL